MRGKIAHEWDDFDGYNITLNAGWQMPGEHRSKVQRHHIVGRTMTDARAQLKKAIRCDCEECEEILAESRNERRASR